MSVLVVSFVLGLVVVIKENITLPVWAYVVALLMGTFIAPFVSSRLLSRLKYPSTDFSAEYIALRSVR